MLRQEFFTKEIRRLLHGGKVPACEWSQSPVLPRTQRAYETHLSAGSTAVLLRTATELESLTRNCTGLIRLPSECIADNALRAVNPTSAIRGGKTR